MNVTALFKDVDHEHGCQLSRIERETPAIDTTLHQQMSALVASANFQIARAANIYRRAHSAAGSVCEEVSRNNWYIIIK